MHEEGPVRFEHEEAYGLREPGGQAACVEDFTAGDQ